ncbi:hypothetical protein GCM10011531_09800 [Aquaticitalea lipolytica]|uniref:Uncharacterized protein n=1 Tax=Aquaticitalea lipolytica TaxID=1247562 RepID=A0A8J2XG19_9FLAO|nr:hypothetical protein GCM10011531_09800 [Aquaticitalea lipolytica]
MGKSAILPALINDNLFLLKIIGDVFFGLEILRQKTTRKVKVNNEIGILNKYFDAINDLVK